MRLRLAKALESDEVLVGDAAVHPTNLGVYRVYLTDYLKNHPRVNREMLYVVRQLQIEQYGLPLQLTVFLLDTGLPEYETAAASIFEHLFTTLPRFGLRPLQWPQILNAAASSLDT